MIGLQAQAGLLFVEAGSEFTFSGGPSYGQRQAAPRISEASSEAPVPAAHEAHEGHHHDQGPWRGFP